MLDWQRNIVACAFLFASAALLVFVWRSEMADRLAQQQTRVQPRPQSNVPADVAPSERDRLSAFWKNKDGKALTYQTLCDKPRNSDDADLCQQWRTAQATEEQAYWAKWQAWVGALGFGGLVLTIILTVINLWQNRKSSQAQLRAYIAFDVKEIGYKNGEFLATVAIRNSGQTPALDLTVIGGIRPAPINNPWIAYRASSKEHPRAIVHNGQSFEHTWNKRKNHDLTFNDIWHHARQGNTVFIYWRAEYKDVFRKRCMDSFGFWILPEDITQLAAIPPNSPVTMTLNIGPCNQLIAHE